MSGARTARLRDGIDGAFHGTSRYLQSVVIALVLAPVLPDAAVDATGAEGWASVGVRSASVLVVLAVSAAAFLVQNWRYRKQARLTPAHMGRVDQRDTLVLPVSLRPVPVYRRERERTGAVFEVGDLLVGAVRPKRVVLVCSDAVDRAPVDEAATAMTTDGLEVEIFDVTNANDVETVLADLEHRIRGYRERGNPWDGATLSIDVTGGTVPISIALLRVAALAGAHCVYVAKEQRGRDIVPGSQHPRQFDPRLLVT